MFHQDLAEEMVGWKDYQQHSQIAAGHQLYDLQEGYGVQEDGGPHIFSDCFQLRCNNSVLDTLCFFHQDPLVQLDQESHQIQCIHFKHL